MNPTGLSLQEYAESIHLYEDWKPSARVNGFKEELVDFVLAELDKETDGLSFRDKRTLLRGTLNTLMPLSLSHESIERLDGLLQKELQEKKITTTKSLIESSILTAGNTAVTLWKGDITTLGTDAIVNAANDRMLGCFQPLHNCIDNAIHSAAGVQLRDDCHTIMIKQGRKESTGTAKITRAYNLPSRFVLHTVGPIVHGMVTEQNRKDLANTYKSCLDLCKETGLIRSVAFCAVSTGVFGYPIEEATQVAIKTVKAWLNKHPKTLDLVVFNVFSGRDETVYRQLLESQYDI